MGATRTRLDSRPILEVASLPKLSGTSYNTTHSKPWDSLSNITKFATNMFGEVLGLRIFITTLRKRREGNLVSTCRAVWGGACEGKPFSSKLVRSLRNLVNATKSENNNIIKTPME